MGRVAWVLFESPLALGALLFLANYGLLVYWRRSGRARPLLAGLGAAVVLLVVQKVVVTQRERASAILSAIEQDVLDSRVEALAQSLSADFSAVTKNREEFIEYARGGLQTVHVSNLSRAALRIEESKAGSFVVHASYSALVEVASGARAPVRSRWRITFVRRDGRWLIGRIELPEVDHMNVRVWDDLRP